jgi:hypothetical protein
MLKTQKLFAENAKIQRSFKGKARHVKISTQRTSPKTEPARQFIQDLQALSEWQQYTRNTKNLGRWLA